VDLVLLLGQGRQQVFGPKDEVLRKVLSRDRPGPSPLNVVPSVVSSS
jgi:ABC-type protease/lipase transport system fused ATPase/permease subunit